MVPLPMTLTELDGNFSYLKHFRSNIS